MNSPESRAATAENNSLADNDRRTLRRAIAASAIGNAVEWYDYGVYAFVAVTIGAVFFPAENAAVQTLLAFMVFAVSFIVRPLGAVVLGPIGDRIGRRSVLALTIIMMSGATLAIGLLPAYATIGVAAPVLLVLCRLLQGFSTGGEYGGAATYMAEYSPDKRRGFYGSFLEFASLAGVVLAAVVAALCYATLGPDVMAQWGWRLPFLVAGPLGLVGLYLRMRLEDTPVFRELEQAGQKVSTVASQAGSLSRSWRMMVVCIGLTLMLNVAVYILLSYMPTYLAGQLGISADSALWMTVIVMVLMMALIPFMGRLSDKVGRKPLWYLSGFGLLILSYPMFVLMSLGSWSTTVIAYAILGTLLVIQMSMISATFPALFPAHVRYAGLAISYSLSVSLFGGTAPLINEFMIPRTSALFPAFYLMAACVVGLVAVAFSPETAGASLRGSVQPRSSTKRRRLIDLDQGSELPEAT